VPELAVSSWSLHRDLGPTYRGLDLVEGQRTSAFPYGPGRFSLLELPEVVAKLGIQATEVCHFHFPETTPGYLAALRARFAAARVRPYTLLIDEGDITAEDPETRERELARICRWIDVAATVGFQRARVIAGMASPDRGEVAVRRSAEGLATLATYGAACGVRVVTENWLGISMDPQSLLTILDRTVGNVGLCVDFGNYDGPGKYAALAQLLPHATSIHAKAEYLEPGVMDRKDIDRCLDLARGAHFDGTYVLIFDGQGEEQANLRQLAQIVQPYL
jgi:sugar phosphate isomerase/epimerase